MPLTPQLTIIKKRDGGELSQAEIEDFVSGVVSKYWADYQISALLMAILLKGMSLKETAYLTKAMLNSGSKLDFSKWKGKNHYVDKHSTGGVGDKISLPLIAMVTSCGLKVPMISGRGLGHSGGTLDKLESIPGFNINLSEEQFYAQMDNLGGAIIGQSKDLVPADKILYALRDVTGTVECIPLICASILSKKLAEDLDGLVLDVKYGKGAFMKSLKNAKKLAFYLKGVTKLLGLPTSVVLSKMDQPLGRTIGNAVEINETYECLQGTGPKDVMDLTYKLGVEMLVLGKIATNRKVALKLLKKSISSGEALKQFKRIVTAQQGMLKYPLKDDSVNTDVLAPSTGVIIHVDAYKLALIALKLGAGRLKVTDTINHEVGISNLVKEGTKVTKGDRLLTLHTATKEEAAIASQELLVILKVS